MPPKAAKQPTPFGHFSVIPQEMLFQVFSSIPLADLGNLALTSRSLRDSVMVFIKGTRQGLEKILPYIAVSDNRENHIEEVVLFDDAVKYTEHFGDLGK